MKKCPYCGKEYPDASTVCAVDGNQLLDTPVYRKKITGLWRGVYGYIPSGTASPLKNVSFTLKLKQGWFGHFTGAVIEDAPEGMPGTGMIDGYYKSPNIEFTKGMPVGYFINKDGSRLTFREYILSQGHPCDHELPSPPIFYEGTFLDAGHVQGTWTIRPWKIPFPDGTGSMFGGRIGYWCAEFITEDLRVHATGGPKDAYFDKSLLAPVVFNSENK
jgi:hypothetical protein